MCRKFEVSIDYLGEIPDGFGELMIEPILESIIEPWEQRPSYIAD